MKAEPKCYTRNCVHFLGMKYIGGLDETNERLICAAYPTGIPDPIAYGDELHIEPYPGDHGIQYAPDSPRR